MAFSGAFQVNAFQDDAFQIIRTQIDPGSRIAAGTFSRGRWREIKRDEEERRLAALRALEKKRREEKEAREARKKAEREARDDARAEANAELARLAQERAAAGAIASLSGIEQLGALVRAAEMNGMAGRSMQREALADQEDEDFLEKMLLGEL